MQINRLFEIVYILLDKKQVTAKELAEHFEVSTRTIYRDVETLSGAGIPIYMNKGKGGGITLLPEFVLNKTVLTEQEKADVLSSLGAVGAVSLSDMQDTLSKFSSLFGGSDGDWIEVDFGLWSDGEREAHLFQSIKQGILQKRVVRFQYASAKGEALMREVEPIKLVFKGTAWYLYGFCRLREDFRFFKLKRMRELEVLEEHFVREIPKTNVVSPYKKMEMAEPIKIVVRVEKEAAYRVYDDFEHCEPQPDGSVIAESCFVDMDWVADYMLGYGELCEVLEPLELRDEIRRKIQCLLKKYQ